MVDVPMRPFVTEQPVSHAPGGITMLTPEEAAALPYYHVGEPHTLRASQLPGVTALSDLPVERLSYPICIPECVVEALASCSVNDLGVQYHLSTKQMQVI